ncbi:MAG: hypothetical protein JRE64_12470 [Deltaproteobacteria bacterium]|nr:hypothetical protein [Deltaproteobacteria bacterium]
MNLFILTWNLTEEKCKSVLNELRSMRKIYPHLSEESISSFGEGKPLFAVCMNNGIPVCLPRRYVSHKNNVHTIYDGCLIDTKDQMAAHDARQLAENWDTLESRLEGHFLVAKINESPPRLEIKNDFLGIYPVYYRKLNGGWLISNSVQLIKKVANQSDFDTTGVSLFLGFGWAGSDRTLDNDIRVLPGGQHWVWSEAEVEPRKRTYFSIKSFSKSRFATSGKSDLQSLASALSNIMVLLKKNYTLLEAPLTAGKDSRLIASILIKNKIKSEFFTGGMGPDTIDAQIASQIGRHFYLEHNMDRYMITSEEIAENWNEASQRMLDTTDGMVSLAHIANVVRRPDEVDSLNVHFYGAGGEIGRQFYENRGYYLHQHSVANVREFLQRRLITRSELVYPDVISTCRQYLNNFIDEALDDGFAAADMPAVFYTNERVRRWAGANLRQLMSYKDVFAPLCTRPFVRAALSLSLMQRYSETLHYSLTKLLTPELFAIPLEKPWRPQSSYRNYGNLLLDSALIKLKAITHIKSPMRRKTKLSNLDRLYLRSNWLEVTLVKIRENCLDHGGVLWDIINRDEFEKLTSNKVSSAERKQKIHSLLNTTTMLYYGR